MYRLADVAGGFLATVGIISLAVSGTSSLDSLSSHLTAPRAVADGIDRTHKGDRLTDARPVHERNLAKIAIVEVVGVRDTAIVYRDRGGRVLFRTDPVANVTVIAKDVRLPQVTVREDSNASPQRTPVKTLEEREPDKQMIGCDPVASPLAGSASRVTGRCIASTMTDGRLAAIVR
jgi:hypothetical protein